MQTENTPVVATETQGEAKPNLPVRARKPRTKKSGVVVAKHRSGPRMNVKPDEVIQHAALMIALVGKRNGLTRWSMKKCLVRELCQTGLRSRMYHELSDCLAEYNLLMMDTGDKYFSFLQVDKTKSWRHVGLKDLTDDERRNPNMEAMEKEIGYESLWDSLDKLTDEERAEYEDA